VAPTINRRDGQQSATVSLTPTGDNLTALNQDVTKALDGLDLPSGAETELGGVSSDQADAFSQLGLALLVAIAIVYVVMVATFRSLIQPLILLVSIPFAAVGALLALVITDTPLGVPSLIGLLMLVGIVVTNAIVLIDLVNHYRAQGESVNEALINGSRRRLRPILMTAIATIFALIPMALGVTGGGVFISQPLAIVVIGGLLSSTVLTLILVPVLYRLVEGRKERKQLARESAREAREAEIAAQRAEEQRAAEQAAAAEAARRAEEEAAAREAERRERGLLGRLFGR
jgi:HAE1 family hydrophobic/amphiphilic exporter-1